MQVYCMLDVPNYYKKKIKQETQKEVLCGVAPLALLRCITNPLTPKA